MTDSNKEEMKQELLKLMDDQKKIEEEIMGLTDTLESPGMPGVKGSLVDEDDFPKEEWDVHHIRTIRHQIAILQTDHVALMKNIETKMYALHEITADDSSPSPPSSEEIKTHAPAVENK